MPAIQPLPESEATEKTEQTYGRIKEMLGTDAVPNPSSSTLGSRRSCKTSS